MFDKIKTHYYYYIQPCPACHSKKTGYFMKIPKFNYDKDWSKEEALRRGELVELVAEVADENVFCTECGFKWYQEIRGSFISGAQLKEEKQNRGIYELLTKQKEHFKNELLEEKKHHKIRHFCKKIFNP